MSSNTPLLADIDDLIIQATHERSHFYVKSVLERAKVSIVELEVEKFRLEAAIREHRDHNRFRSDRLPCSSDDALWAALDATGEGV